MTTKQATEKLFNTPFKDLQTNLNENTWKSYKKRFKENKLPIEKIEELLEKSGYKVIQEKLWQ